MRTPLHRSVARLSPCFFLPPARNPLSYTRLQRSQRGKAQPARTRLERARYIVRERGRGRGGIAWPARYQTGRCVISWMQRAAPFFSNPFSLSRSPARAVREKERGKAARGVGREPERARERERDVRRWCAAFALSRLPWRVGYRVHLVR